MTAELKDIEFATKIEGASKPVLVDFWAEWCGPCRMLSPIISELADEMKDQISIYKMNVDENPETPSKFGIRGIPTMIIFKNGQQQSVKVGALPKDSIKAWIKENL